MSAYFDSEAWRSPVVIVRIKVGEDQAFEVVILRLIYLARKDL